jgi:hypothetical protein
MSIVSQRFSRISNDGGAPARENNVVSLSGAIGACGLPPGPDVRPCKSFTCSDAMRTAPNGRLRSLLRLTECSHHVGSSGLAHDAGQGHPGTFAFSTPTYRHLDTKNLFVPRRLWMTDCLGSVNRRSIEGVDEPSTLTYSLIPQNSS